jgi:Rhodopirellula transposase DDE domain
MDGDADQLLISAARQLRGSARRMFLAEVCETLCQGSPRQAESRFGWGRETVEKGMAERALTAEERAARPSSGNRGRKPWEEQHPQLAVDIRLIVEPHTHTDPELKTERLYSNLSAAEVRTALLEKGYTDDELPSERTLRDILNRMHYRLKRIQKGKPLKKTEHTDAIFENVKAVRSEAADDPQTLEISVDTKAKVKLGEYSQGGKSQNRQRRQRREGVGS